MAVIKQGILGGFSGRIGNVVGSSWKGIAIIKSLPLSVANPRTASQVSNRSGWSLIVAFASAILVSVIKPMLDRFASQMSGFNSFVKTNRDYFDATGLITPESLVIGSGVVTMPDVSSLAYTSGTHLIEFDLGNNTGVGDALATDELYGMAYCPELDLFAEITDHKHRDYDAPVQLSMLGVTTGMNIYLWTAMRRVDGTKTSDTAYLTIVAL